LFVVATGGVWSIASGAALWVLREAWSFYALGLILFALGLFNAFVVLWYVTKRLGGAQLRLHEDLLGQLAELREHTVSAAAPPTPVAVRAVAVSRPARIIGIDVGRSRITGGLLQTDGPLEFGFPGPVGYTDPIHLTGPLGTDIYDRLAELIKDIVRRADYLDGIGIGLPGHVDPISGAIVKSPGGLASQEPFVENLAARISREPFLAGLLAQDLRQPRDLLHREIASAIYVDNDANCAARGVLNQNIGDPGWQNFACVLVGTGVGAGLVLRREVYYGSGGAAGEVGHTIIGVDPALSEPGPEAPGKVTYEPGDCVCGQAPELIHWEVLVSGSGLVRMMRQLTPGLYKQLQANLAREPVAADLWTLARATMRGGASHPDYEPYRAILRDDQLRTSAPRLLGLHARYLAFGLTNMANTLNLDHIVMAGGVMDGLMSVPDYREEVWHHLKTLLLETPGQGLVRVLFDPKNRQRSAPWQGAALLRLDPSFSKPQG
jgi:predicted NBD/HSP70 family sugar kinase